MGTLDGLRFVATLIGGGFLVYAALSLLKGTLYDRAPRSSQRSSRAPADSEYVWHTSEGVPGREVDP